MADIFQESIGRLIPKGDGISIGTKLSGINPWDIAIAMEVIFLILLIIYVVYVFKVYRYRILELEDRGRGSLRARILWAKPLTENGIPRYVILGKKDEHGKPLKITATTTDNTIPLRTIFGFYKDIVIMYKDKNGDYRPYKPITDKAQIDLEPYRQLVDNQKLFNVTKFLDELFPVLKIDNLKMRGWYALMTKETLNLYKDKSDLMKKLPSIMVVLFIIFGLGVGAYMVLN